jgi:transcriptional regulator, MarR family
MECIMALGEPTISQFSHMMNISAPNTAYRVSSLIQKGYLEKVQSRKDQREYHLRPTRKYLEYYNINSTYLEAVVARCKERFSDEDYKKLTEMVTIIGKELMPESDLSRFKQE